MAEESVDYRWVMEMTFILTVVIGTPIIALGGLLVEFDGWTGRVVYATTIAALVWFLTAISVYLYARGTLKRP